MSSIIRSLKELRRFKGLIDKEFYKKVYLYSERQYLKNNKLICTPSRIKINTGYVCNLSCPMCPTGLTKKRIAPELTFAQAYSYLPKIESTKYISLYGWGEPFLNKDIFKIIELYKRNNKYIMIDSNLSYDNKNVLENIINSDWDYLSVSIDGVDQNSYSSYRYGGDYNLVIDNVKQILNRKKTHQIIEWQFLVNNKNAQYCEEAASLAQELGIPIKLYPFGLYIDIFYNHSVTVQKEWLTPNELKSYGVNTGQYKGGTCMYMYDEPYIDTDGKLYPCCNSVHAPQDYLDEGFINCFGNINDSKMSEIWNNNKYILTRALLSGNMKKHLNKVTEFKPICLRCRVYYNLKGKKTDIMPIFTYKKP